MIGHPLSSSSIYNDPWHPLCSVYELDSPLGQPLSRSSLVFLLALDHQLYTPCISSPNHHHLFAAHAHTNAACFTNAMSSIPSLSLSSLLGCLSFNLTPHIHLTILISAHWSVTTFSFLTGQVSLPCSMLLRTQLLYNLPLVINDTSLLVSSGTSCLNLFQPIRILASTAASASPSSLHPHAG